MNLKTPERNRQQDTQPGFFNKQITRQNKTEREELQIKRYWKYTSVVLNVDTYFGLW